MLNRIHFIVPIRSTRLMKDPALTRKYLKELFLSIKNQTSSNWMLHLVHDKDLGEFLPKHPFKKHHFVDFEPKCDPEKVADLKEYFNDFRLDKGLRVYEAYKSLNGDDFFMVIDDDDLIHCELTEYISKLSETKQLIILKRGYEYRDSTGKLLKLNHFDRECGTSLVAQVRQYKIFGKNVPNKSDYIELGSHTLIKKRMRSNKEAYVNVKRRLAIYRTQHLNSSTGQINHIRTENFFGKIKKVTKYFSFRSVDRSMLKEKFGQQ